MPRKSVSVTIGIWMACAAIVSAQEPGARGPGRGMMMYDKAHEETVTGTVSEVTDVAEPAGRGRGMALQGLHLMLKTDSRVLDIRLGPKAFVDEQGFTFAVGDVLTVTGARGMGLDESGLIARTIVAGDRRLELRDADGMPLWAMRGRPN